MSLYPSLELMKVDHMLQAQDRLNEQHHAQSQAGAPPMETLPYPVHPSNPSAGYPVLLYPSLTDYMGLEITPEMQSRYTPPQQDLAVSRQNQLVAQQNQLVARPNFSLDQRVGEITGMTVATLRDPVSHGVRELTLCKDHNGKIGVKVREINKGVFIILVQKESPAALAGIRFGDQILQVNNNNVAGYSEDKMHNVFKKCANNGIIVAVRDRPFERTVTLHKDSTGHIGFLFKNGKIISIVQDSSAARNGMLTDHQILEVNGQNVVGLKDKELTEIIKKKGTVLMITIMPSFFYDHMMKHISPALVQKEMNHRLYDL